MAIRKGKKVVNGARRKNMSSGWGTSINGSVEKSRRGFGGSIMSGRFPIRTLCGGGTSGEAITGEPARLVWMLEDWWVLERPSEKH